MRPTAASHACLLVLALAGCGTADREDDAAAVAERFHSALEAGDGTAACAQLNPETASALERQEQKPCEEAILRLELPKGGSDFLDEGPLGWRVSAAGCEPTAPSQPYDCELEN